MPPRVLIVDDEPAIVDILAEYVGATAVVETALSGAEALAAVTRSRPDLVLLDMSMPGMNGLEVMRHLRAIAPGIPVILVTATADDTAVAEALKAGAFSYIPKPFSFKYVQHLVAAALVKRTR